MKNEARFSVVVGALEESMKSSFEDMCQRYGIPVESPLKKNLKGQYVAASGLSLSRAQQIRRQISGAGYSVDIQSDSESGVEDAISSIAISLDPDTLVVNNGLLDESRPEDVSDILSHAWGELEFPSPDGDISEDVMLPDDDGEHEETTISVSARQLLDAVSAVDRVEKSPFSMSADHVPEKRPDEVGAGSAEFWRVSRNRQGTSDSRHASIGLGKAISLKNEAVHEAATPAKPVSGVSEAFKTPTSGISPTVGGNQLIPPSDIAFEVSEVTDAMDEEALAEDQLIDVGADLGVAVTAANVGKAGAAPQAGAESKNVTQVAPMPNDTTNVANLSAQASSGGGGGADSDSVDEETVVRKRRSIECLKAAFESEVSEVKEVKEVSEVKEVKLEGLPVRKSKSMAEAEPEGARLPVASDTGSGVSAVLVVLTLIAAALVILTLIHLYVSPVSFVESLAKPF